MIQEETFVLSIDIGLRNMCFSVLKQSNPLVIKKQQKEKKSKQNLSNNTNIDSVNTKSQQEQSHQIVSKSKKEDKIIVNPDSFDIIKVLVKDIGDKDQFVIIKNLRLMLDEVISVENSQEKLKIKYIIVEKQIGKFSFKQLEYAIFMYIQLQFPDIQMFSIHPCHKLKIQFEQDKESQEIEKQQKGEISKENAQLKSKYGQNKKDAKQQLQLYEKLKKNQDISHILQQNNKNQPDIADCLLQTYFVFATLNIS